MFPPIEDAILQNNPKFAALHKTLTTRILNPDGSSINPATLDRDAKAAEALKKARTTATKVDILCTSVAALPLNKSTATARSVPDLPPDLLELIVLLSLQLTASPSLSPADLKLLQSTDIYSSLEDFLPAIAEILSTHLHSQALALARLLHPDRKQSQLERHISTLPSDVQTLQSSLSTAKLDLAVARARLVPLTLKVLESYRLATSTIIQILEQNKHGLLARNVKARAEFAAVSAQQQELDAKIAWGTGLGNVYTEEVKAALGNYAGNLRVGRQRLRERGSEAEKELARYGVGREGDGGVKEKTMKEIARVFGEMGKQVEEVRKDIERLQGK